MDTPSRPDKPLLSQAGETQGVLSDDMETLMHVISHDLRAPHCDDSRLLSGAHYGL